MSQEDVGEELVHMSQEEERTAAEKYGERGVDAYRVLKDGLETFWSVQKEMKQDISRLFKDFFTGFTEVFGQQHDECEQLLSRLEMARDENQHKERELSQFMHLTRHLHEKVSDDV